MYRTDVGLSGGSDKFKFTLIWVPTVKMEFKNSANRYDQYSIRANLDARQAIMLTLSFGPFWDV